jgi:hypothetical protein
MANIDDPQFINIVQAESHFGRRSAIDAVQIAETDYEITYQPVVQVANDSDLQKQVDRLEEKIDRLLALLEQPE